MATIAENLQRIVTAKANLKTAIEGKGVEVPANAHIDAYPALVDAIEQGGGGGVEKLEGDFVVATTSNNIIVETGRTDAPKLVIANNKAEVVANGEGFSLMSVITSLARSENTFEYNLLMITRNSTGSIVNGSTSSATNRTAKYGIVGGTLLRIGFGGNTATANTYFVAGHEWHWTAYYWD